MSGDEKRRYDGKGDQESVIMNARVSQFLNRGFASRQGGIATRILHVFAVGRRQIVAQLDLDLSSYERLTAQE